MKPCVMQPIEAASTWRRHMISPLFLAFDAAHGAVRDALVGRSIVQYASNKFFLVYENANALDALAARPKPDFVETITDQVCPTDRCSEP
jgi:hypothetical protein